MKKIMSLVAAGLLIAGVASAQTDSTKQHHGFEGRKMAMRHAHADMYKKLNLTDDQKAQMKAANEDFRKQLTTLKSNNSITMGDYKTQEAALRKSHREKINSILTDDQKKQLADQRQAARKHMQKAAAANLDKMKQNLNLSDDQVAKIKAQRADLHTKMKAIREDASLQPDQKKAQVKELVAQQKEQLKSILTPEQQTKLDSLRKTHMGHRGDFRGQAK